MPYLDNDTKYRLEGDGIIQSSGELNYVLTSDVLSYLQTHGLSYQTCNDIVGALDNCKREWRRI